MRLIDADQMAVDESEAYMSAQVQITDDLKWLVNFAAHSKIQMLIADTPTVDAVPVVRCKECVHYDMGVCLKIYSDGNTHPEAWQNRRTEDFCSYGERKEGAEC